MLEVDVKKKLRDFPLDVRSLTVNDGETLGLLGTNGAGKSTVLKLISGLMKPDAGRIVLDGTVLYDRSCRVNLSPEERNIGYMFQSYALFPHMTAAENIAYGLCMRHMPKADIEVRVEELITTLGIADIADEPVTQMSGGQRQRTALARALAPRPSLLLLDEPLSALDSKTQDMMRRELAAVIRAEGISCILVTHSVADALTVADRLSIIDNGMITVSGTPEEIVTNPEHGFVTSENMNLFRGEVYVKRNGVVLVQIGSVFFRAVTPLLGAVFVSIRPEELILSQQRFVSTAMNVFEGVVERIEPSGVPDGMYVYVYIGIPLVAAVTRQSVERLGILVGGKITVTCKATSVRVFV